jgi:hypothetical protein
LSENSLTLIEACDKAAEIVTQSSHLDKLYLKAVECIGVGELRNRILELVAAVIKDEALREEVFVSGNSLVAFFLGVWIQFLLVEIAGVKKERLRVLAKKMFKEIQQGKSLN